MVDAQHTDPAVLDQAQDEPVRGGEDAIILDSDAGQVVDCEETPVVDLLARRSPVGEPVGLRLEQRMERL